MLLNSDFAQFNVYGKKHKDQNEKDHFRPTLEKQITDYIGIVTGFLVLAVCSQKRARMKEKITNFFSKKKLD